MKYGKTYHIELKLHSNQLLTFRILKILTYLNQVF